MIIYELNEVPVRLFEFYANAYHVPEGILMHYSPKSYMDLSHIEKWKNISALDFAPSLLEKFSLDVPSYMSGDTKLFSAVN